MKLLVAVAFAMSTSACEVTPYVTTPLDGGVPCGSGADTCSGGQVCIEQFLPGRDPNPTRCFAPPDGCYIFDCAKEKCAPCVRAQCDPVPVAVVGRTVYCEEGVAP